MKKLKGFITIQSLLSNIPGVISPLGELSTRGYTYAIEKGDYISNTLRGYRLTTFRSRNEVDENIETPGAIVEQAISVTAAAYNYASGHLLPYDTNDFKLTLENALGSTGSDFTMGSIVSNGTLGLPEWVAYISNLDGDVYVKLWYSESAFTSQFDEYEITVIPPLDNLDTFFLSPVQVINALRSVTLVDLFNKANSLKGKNSETVIRITEIYYYDPVAARNVGKSTWLTLIYGIQGDNNDAIKEAIAQYLEANSNHPVSDWKEILPDLYITTEFIILPRWDKISIPGLPVASQLYSSIGNVADILSFITGAAPFYPSDSITSHTNLLPFLYKGVLLVVLNGTDNVLGKQDIRELIPDYLALSTEDLDFSRMSLYTQGWVVFIAEMIKTADEMDDYSTIPSQLRRVQRGGKKFISGTYQDIGYLVAPRYDLR